jgi:nucleotide-binding universal stress UspA family protein
LKQGEGAWLSHGPEAPSTFTRSPRRAPGPVIRALLSGKPDGGVGMFKHLLVTLDGTARSEAVIPHAIDIATSMNTRITLMRIVDAAASDWSERGAIGKGHLETTSGTLMTMHAQEYLDRVAAQIRQRGVKVDTFVEEGAAAKKIIAAARDLDADGIAMATHSRRGINKLMFGSVAEAVVHEASVPVLLVRVA